MLRLALFLILIINKGDGQFVLIFELIH